MRIILRKPSVHRTPNPVKASKLHMKLSLARNFEIRFPLLRIFQGASFLSIFRMESDSACEQFEVKKI